MKTLTLSFQLLTIYFFIAAFQVNAQQAEHELLPFNSDHYECFQTLECITSNQDLIDKGWRFIFDETSANNPQGVTATMKGKNIWMSASYNKQGELIRATYKRQNLALPPALLVHLSDDKYYGWRMVANEKDVKNFDINSTVYKVTMQNGNSIKKLRFTQADVDGFENETGYIINR